MEISKQQETIDRLSFSMKHSYYNDAVDRILYNGEIVEFINPSFKQHNIDLFIKGEPGRKIWYSQLSNFGIFFKPELGYGLAELCMKDHNRYCIRDLGKDRFWQIVNGRSFRVEYLSKIEFVVDDKSDILVKRPDLLTIGNLFNYIQRCIDSNSISELETILKKGSIYDLHEV